MRTTIDKAGRMVLPKSLREQVGMREGEVDITTDGAGLRIEPIAGDELIEREGRWVVPPSGEQVDDELVRALRDAGQR